MNRTLSEIELGHCPYCHKPMLAQVALEFTSEPSITPQELEVAVTLRAVGMNLAHNCIPPTQR